MKKIILLLCVIGSTRLSSQIIENKTFCGQEQLMNIIEKQYPGYQENVDRSFEFAHRQMDLNAETRSDIYTIPIVVHIVWNAAEENLADSIIHSQIDALNEAYRLKNKDKDNLRSIFKDLQEDAGIEFKLQEIKRVKTSTFFTINTTTLPDKVKSSAKGGSDAADTDKYLNIWVCKIQNSVLFGQLLGYAYPPSNLVNWPGGSTAPTKDLEGVVIDFRVFGRNNPIKYTIANTLYKPEGKTTVHEVGHYLGLRHIWGDGLLNGCSVDDGINDTPNQKSQSTSCNKNANTCQSTFDDLPDLIENYMDYSPESCQNTFTKEQVGLMRSVLNLQRKNIVLSADELIMGEFISIFPNPVSHMATIHLSSRTSTQKCSVRVLNAMGANILEKQFEGQHAELDFSNVVSGLYFIEVNVEGHKFISRIVVTH